MFRRIVAGLAATVPLMASPLAAAKTYCYTAGGFSACASAAVTVNAGHTTLTVAIQNLSRSSGNTVYNLTALGLYYLQPPNYTGSIKINSTPKGWQNGPGSALTKGGPTIHAGQKVLWLGGSNAAIPSTQGLLGCAPFPRNTKGISTCAAPAIFTFSLTAGNNFNLNALDIAFRGQSWQQPTPGGPNPPSEFFNCYSTDRTCVVPTSVPEPATMTLLAIGLVGIGGMGWVRRRRGTP